MRRWRGPLAATSTTRCPPGSSAASTPRLTRTARDPAGGTTPGRGLRRRGGGLRHRGPPRRRRGRRPPATLSPRSSSRSTAPTSRPSLRRLRLGRGAWVPWRARRGRGGPEAGGARRGRTLVPPGTVVFAEVLGRTLSGRPLLSARRLFRRLAWHRARQVESSSLYPFFHSTLLLLSSNLRSIHVHGSGKLLGITN